MKINQPHFFTFFKKKLKKSFLHNFLGYVFLYKINIVIVNDRKSVCIIFTNCMKSKSSILKELRMSRCQETNALFFEKIIKF